MFKTETQQAFRALAVLAQHKDIMVVSGIASQAQIPAPMLAKVLHRLTRHDLVIGQPGPGGGFRLARPPAEIRLREVVTAVEGPAFACSCLFGLPHCSDQVPCPLHSFWSQMRGRLLMILDQHTVADLAHGLISWPPAVDGADIHRSR